jgi:hypothetical protein
MDWDWIQLGALVLNLIKTGLDLHDRWKVVEKEKSLTSKERRKRTKRKDSRRVTDQQ